MTNDEAMKLARDLMPRNAGQSVLVTSADLRRLCHAILSGDMKREIENAAYERAAKLVDDVGEERRADLHDPEVEAYAATQLLVCERIAEDLRALITPAKTADTEG